MQALFRTDTLPFAVKTRGCRYSSAETCLTLHQGLLGAASGAASSEAHLCTMGRRFRKAGLGVAIVDAYRLPQLVRGWEMGLLRFVRARAAGARPDLAAS